MVTAASALSGTDADGVTAFRSVCTPSAFSSIEATTVEADDPETNTGCRSPVAPSGSTETGLDAISWAAEDVVSAPDGASTTEGGAGAEAGGFTDVSWCVPTTDDLSTCSRANLKQKYMQSSMIEKRK